MLFGLIGKPQVETTCFGVLAEFENGAELLEAIRASRAKGYSKMEAYTPLPMHEVWEALGHTSPLPSIVLVGGLVGAAVGYGLQYWSSVIYYPMNVGGRPLNSWPSFIPVTFETTILFAAFSAFLGMLALNGLPRPHHPCFEIPQFENATRDRYFLLLMAHDPDFELERARADLAGLEPLSVAEVPNP
ncbi:MAG: DUF3341 domain-containing protein [Planctomycetota bacterium]